ncbi:MAG: S41 family peptidase [Candidatus Fermentibacteraceae bacterium]
MKGLRRPFRIIAGLAAISAVLVCGCLDDPVEYGDYNVLIAELSLAWNTFDQHYVGFVEADVDWDQSWETACGRMDTVVSYRGLGRVIWQMEEPLQDPGVHLSQYNTGWSGTPYMVDPTFNIDTTLHDQYLDSLGYQQVESSWGYCLVADSTVPMFVITGWTGFSFAVFDEVFNPMLEYAEGMIVDARRAPGSSYSMYISMPQLVANRFADELRDGYYRQYRNGPARDDLCEPIPYRLHPRGGFTGPTLVLMGQQNSSLTERFLSMMGSLPHVTLAGDTTYGRADASTQFDLGGGRIGVPDTSILAWNGQRIQRYGIPPEVSVPADSEDFAAGVDPVLEHALEWAEGLRPR